MLKAICQEILLQKSYLSNKQLQSVYFGGGTPSLLEERDLQAVWEIISKIYTLSPTAEITLEANPDDLNLEKLKILYKLGINRLSIGIQSFYEHHLVFLHRSHNATQAEYSVKMAQDVGFDNISIDLIYAIPAPNHAIWEKDLTKALALQVSHISAYCLTIEPRTVFGKRVARKQMPPIDDAFARTQMQMLIDSLTQAGFEQYEISNFARNRRYSIHNTNYWLGGEYLGIGPSAHSYNGRSSRQFNIANNKIYIAEITKGNIPATVEKLSVQDQLNEYLLTSLRTQWGAEKDKILAFYPQFFQQNERILQKYIEQGLLQVTTDRILLSTEGKFFADQIAADLFWIK